MERDILEYFRNNTRGRNKRENIIFEHFALLQYALDYNENNIRDVLIKCEKEDFAIVPIYPMIGDAPPSDKYFIGDIIDGELYYLTLYDEGLRFPTKDELTTEMHADFTVSDETQTKHRVFSLLTLCGTDKPAGWEEWMDGYNVTIEDINKHIQEYIDLKNGIG